MPIITAIKPQKVSPLNKAGANRVNVYLDYKFGFGIDLETFVKLKLKVEQELTDDQVEEAKNLGYFQKILGNLLNFATLRPRSEKEIKDWFFRKKVPESFQEKLISKLGKYDLLGDEKFAKWWVDSRIQFKYKSKKEISFELQKKGVSREIIDKILGESEINEEEFAKKLMDKKAYRWGKLPPVERRKKMTQFLARKGYGWEVIKKLIGEID